MPEFNTEHMDRFLQRVEGMKSTSTYRTVRAALLHFDEWLTETDRSPTDVGPIELEDFLTELSTQDYAPASVGLYFNNVREFYKYLVRIDVLEENPAEDVDRGHIRSLTKGTRKTAESEIVYVTAEEVEAMVEHVPQPKLRNRLVIKLLYHTGIRAHECASIRLDNVDREERCIRVRSEKTADWRSVYYRPSLDLPLREWIDGGYRAAFGTVDKSPYLFPSKQSEKVNSDMISNIVSTAAENCGIQETMYVDAAGSNRRKYAAHALRHGFAVWFIRNGGDIRTLQRLLGHADLGTTEQYLEIVDSDIKEAYERVSDAAAD